MWHPKMHCYKHNSELCTACAVNVMLLEWCVIYVSSHLRHILPRGLRLWQIKAWQTSPLISSHDGELRGAFSPLLCSSFISTYSLPGPLCCAGWHCPTSADHLWSHLHFQVHPSRFREEWLQLWHNEMVCKCQLKSWGIDRQCWRAATVSASRHLWLGSSAVPPAARAVLQWASPQQKCTSGVLQEKQV